MMMTMTTRMMGEQQTEKVHRYTSLQIKSEGGRDQQGDERGEVQERKKDAGDLLHGDEQVGQLLERVGGERAVCGGAGKYYTIWSGAKSAAQHLLQRLYKTWIWQCRPK